MKKKFITLLLCAAVGIGALSGCGGNTSAKELPEDSVAAALYQNAVNFLTITALTSTGICRYSDAFTGAPVAA